MCSRPLLLPAWNVGARPSRLELSFPNNACVVLCPPFGHPGSFPPYFCAAFCHSRQCIGYYRPLSSARSLIKSLASVVTVTTRLTLSLLGHLYFPRISTLPCKMLAFLSLLGFHSLLLLVGFRHPERLSVDAQYRPVPSLLGLPSTLVVSPSADLRYGPFLSLLESLASPVWCSALVLSLLGLGRERPDVLSCHYWFHVRIFAFLEHARCQ